MSDQKAPARWPFDPMQPGDHEPVRLPEAARELEKHNPPPRDEKEKDHE